MQKLYDFTVNTLFAGFIKRDQVVMQWIADSVSSSSLQEEEWRFSIPQLFECSLALYPLSGAVIDAELKEGYVKFRQLLYSNQTNTVLKNTGGIVVLCESNVTHALSVYALKRAA